MSAELLKRADDAKARNKMMETIPGSGFHPEDRDHKGRLMAPQKNGLPPIRDHAIAFHPGHESSVLGVQDVRFVGPDAERVAKALAEHVEALKALPPYLLDGTSRTQLWVLPMLELAKAQDGTPLLVLPQVRWNDILAAIYARGIGITGLCQD